MTAPFYMVLASENNVRTKMGIGSLLVVRRFNSLTDAERNGVVWPRDNRAKKHALLFARYDKFSSKWVNQTRYFEDNEKCDKSVAWQCKPGVFKPVAKKMLHGNDALKDMLDKPFLRRVKTEVLLNMAPDCSVIAKQIKETRDHNLFVEATKDMKPEMREQFKASVEDFYADQDDLGMF